MAVNRVIFAGNRESIPEHRDLPCGARIAATVGPTTRYEYKKNGEPWSGLIRSI